MTKIGVNEVHPKYNICEWRLLRDCGELVVIKQVGTWTTPKRLIPLSSTMFALILPLSDSITYFKTTDDWRSFAANKSTDKVRLDFIESNLALNLPTSALSVLLKKAQPDFTIVCDNGDIEVNSVILSTLWPWFKTIVDKTESKSLRIRYPVTWITALVSHFYSDENLDFDTATGLVIVAQQYAVQLLLFKAMRRIRDEKMTIVQALTAWRRANLAENEAVRDYCAREISALIPHLKGSDEAQKILEELEKKELVTLLNGLCLGESSE